MVDLPGGKTLGTQADPVTDKPIDAAESDDLMTCPACGGVIDLRDLNIVLAHLAPLPHPGGDGTN
jgi:hypothetical protein